MPQTACELFQVQDISVTYYQRQIVLTLLSGRVEISFKASLKKKKEKVSEQFKERLIFELPDQDYAGCSGRVEVTS